MKRKAEDLRCGDRFEFRGVKYVALLCANDDRTSMTVVTCLTEARLAEPVTVVTGIRFHRLFEVEVDAHLPVELVVLDHTEDEIKSIPLPAQPMSMIF